MPAPAKSSANSAARNRSKRGEIEVKKTYAAKSTPRGPLSAEAVVVKISRLPFELQQLVLNVFKDSFPDRFGEDLEELVQEIKGFLFKREFESAFCFGDAWEGKVESAGSGEEGGGGTNSGGDTDGEGVDGEEEKEVRVRDKSEFLEGYAVRWSPSRALGYMEILYEIVEGIVKAKEMGDTGRRDVKIACLGGGAGAEIASLAGVLKFLLGDMGSKEGGEAKIHFDVDLVDIAGWADVTEKLHHGLTTGPPISKYASAAVKAANVPLVPAEFFQAKFHQEDILSLTPAKLSTLLADRDLITLFFTLNELYTASLAQTQAFLHRLTATVAPGTLLLIIDSAGSYSTVAINGKGEKRYPMHWLLDLTLLDEGEKLGDVGRKWEKVKEEESRWYRIPEGLTYKVELENMRIQVHLYRRV
jgi:25S rRNA (uracil2843-N3)-methyltransferase